MWPILRTVPLAGRRNSMAKSHLKLVAPSTEKRTATPTRRPNAELRTRAPDRDRDREAAQSSRNEPLGPPGRHDDLGGLPPRGLRAKLVACARTKSISPPPPCTSAGSSRAHLRPIRFSATNCGPYAGYSGSRNRSRHSCSRPNVARRSARRALLAWWSALVFPRYPSPRPETTHQRLALRTGARYRQRKARHNRPG